MSVVKGVLSNGVASIVSRGVRILDRLLLVPFFLTSWGAEYYGEWLTLSIIPSVLAFSDLGFGSAVCNSFVLAYAAGDKQKAVNLRKSGFWIITASVLIGALLTIGVLTIGRNYHLFDRSIIDARSAMLAVTFMMVSRLISFYFQLVEGFFRAVRRAAIGSLIGSGCQTIGILVGFAVLMMGGDVVAYAFSNFLVSTIYAVIYWIVGSKFIDLRGYSGEITKSDVRMIVSKGMGYMMSPIWQSIYFQGGTFVVRVALGVEAVALFNTLRTVCHSINQLFSIINSSIFPDLQFEYGKGNMTMVHRLFRISVLISMVLGTLGTLLLMFFGLDLYEIWTCSMLTVPQNVWYTFMIGTLLNAVWWTSVVTYRVTNQPYHFAITSTVGSLISVGLSYVFALQWGLLGAVIGTVSFDLMMAFYVLPDTCHILGMRVRDLFCHIPEDWSMIRNRIKARLKTR